ncbi:PIF1 [Trichoderma harzianum]|uniref:ATP-dependent DNA helicase n=1 Tax=Trichoderma harzianum TaxID=5544 RepID=A0A0G0APB0_TRIHA|nr:PIF1 [Trichoderma harzianum]
MLLVPSWRRSALSMLAPSSLVRMSCYREYANSKKKKNKKQAANGEAFVWSVDNAESIEIGSSVLSEALNTTVDLMPKQPYKIGESPELSAEQKKLVSLAVEGHNIFYTGSAGCGKSTVLREMRDRLLGMGKAVHVLAPTGKVAMANRGSTTWSFAGWTPNTHKFSLSELKAFVPGQVLLDRFRNADTIILDEVSMVEAMHFDRLNEIMKAAWSPFDERSTLPFGGTQIIVTGDFCQLPPVKPFLHCFECGSDLVPNKQQKIYKCPSTECGASYHDDDKWAFRSKAWDECNFDIPDGLVNGAQGVIIGFEPFEDVPPDFEIRDEGLPVYWPEDDLNERKILEFMMGCHIHSWAEFNFH